MDSSNLSVILAPNLLHSGDCPEKINANTEKRLKLQAAVVHCFIENAASFGISSRHLQFSWRWHVPAPCLTVCVCLCCRCVTSVPPRQGSRHDGL